MFHNSLLFLGGMGASEIIIIALIVLLLFGGRKIPELMRGLGRGVREFKDRKSTRLNSSHVKSSYADFCLKKKNQLEQTEPPRQHGKMRLLADELEVDLSV